MSADIDLFALEQDQQAGDEIALGYAPSAGLRGFTVTGGDGYGDQTAGQLSPAQKIHDRPADGGCVHYQSFSAAQLGARDQAAHMLDYGWIIEAEGQAFQVTEGMARDDDRFAGDQAAADYHFGDFESGEGCGIVDLAQVQAKDVFNGDDSRMEEVFNGTLRPWGVDERRAGVM